jgi:uncharacterized protein YukJ
MGVANYGVLRGRLLEMGREDDLDSPHFQVIVGAQGRRWRVPVNVRSQDAAAPNVLYKVVDPFAGHPLLARLGELGEGFTALPERRPGLTLDFVRDALATCREMRPLPHSAPGADNDLQDLLELHLRRVQREAGAEVFAWGARFDVGQPRPADVQFRTTAGVHDIHMNQGNPPGRFFGDNGVHQDGALLLSFPGSGTFVALFLAFQSQAFDTDEQGRPRPDAQPCGRVEPPSFGDVRIVAALVNPVGTDPGLETVTLLNLGASAVDLAGWALADRQAKRERLSGVLPAGETLRVRLTGQGAQLGNQGGVITLEDPSGTRVHSTSYAQSQAGQEGRTVFFGS